MEVQYHPASGRRTVKAISIGPRAQWALAFAAALAVLAGASLWWLVPAVAARTRRIARVDEAVSRADAARGEAARAAAGAATLAERELAWGDRLARIGFLYGADPAHWPRALDPGRGLVSPAGSRRVEGLAAYAEALETARAAIADVEERDPGLAARTPSIAPVRGTCEPATLFGPRVSPWTGEEEFFTGVDLAAPEGSAVVAPADGRVVFTGRPRHSAASRLWQLGGVIVIAHGPENATLFGHLARIEVRTGERVRRGQRIGTVGKTGWALSPRLHYELWRPRDRVWRPTDPLFAVLDRPFDPRHLSLEQMRGTSAPDSAESLPGLP